jgi:hypothetical protein
MAQSRLTFFDGRKKWQDGANNGSLTPIHCEWYGCGLQCGGNHMAYVRGYVVLVILSALLAACEVERRANVEYTNTGQELGARGFREIDVSDSKISFAGDDPVKRREAEILKDRYVERITFKNNGVLRYSKLFSGGFISRDTPTDMIRSSLDMTFYKDKGINFDGSKIRKTSQFTYLLQSSPTYNCFVAFAYFGTGTNARQDSPGNQSIAVSMCYGVASKSAAALEAEMVDILSRVRYDDGIGNRARGAPSGPVAASVSAPAIGKYESTPVFDCEMPDGSSLITTQSACNDANNPRLPKRSRQSVPVIDCRLPDGSSLITTQSACEKASGTVTTAGQPLPPQATVTATPIPPAAPPRSNATQIATPQTGLPAPATTPRKAADWRQEARMPSRVLTVNLRGTDLYKLVAPSVYFVGASSPGSDTVSLGAAVAVSRSILITNCHVVANSKYILLKKDRDFGTATIVGGDKISDRCFLRSTDMALTPVQGIRTFQSLEVGEDVYAVGNPKGFESTFSPGIISAKRPNFEAGLNYIQTTAPITNGSSGGALFDNRGNLVGINTLAGKGEGSLGFAISADEFWRH